jgi:adenosylcobinamide-GDP ribazoletransferase
MISRDSQTLVTDLVGGFGLLTRIPLPLTAAPRPDACWGWPLVGLVVAGLGAATGGVAVACGMPAGPAAALVLVVQALLTGGLHEDGLADTADGLFGGRDKARRLEIMKDSRIGSYGTLALLLVTLLRWSALAVVLAQGHWGAVLAAGAISRVPMAALMAGLPNARGSGLSAMVGQPSQGAAFAAGVLAVVLALVFAGSAAVPMALLAGAAAWGLGAYAKARIGGQTGDILGASQQLAEAAVLLVAASL